MNEQWERPAHDWGDRTAWRLFNAATFALTGRGKFKPFVDQLASQGHRWRVRGALMLADFKGARHLHRRANGERLDVLPHRPGEAEERVVATLLIHRERDLMVARQLRKEVERRDAPYNID